MPQVGKVNASNGMLVQMLVTDNVTAHAVAVDANTGSKLITTTSQGIVVYNLKSGMAGSGNFTGSTTTSGGTTAATTAKASGAVRAGIQVIMSILLITIVGLLVL